MDNSLKYFHDLYTLGITFLHYLRITYLYYFFKPTKIRSITNGLVMVHYLIFNHYHVNLRPYSVQLPTSYQQRTQKKRHEKFNTNT